MSKTLKSAASEIGFLAGAVNDKSTPDQLRMVASGILAARPSDAEWSITDLLAEFNSGPKPMVESLRNMVVSLEAERAANTALVEPFVATITDPYAKTFTTKAGKERTNVIPAMIEFHGGEWKHSGKWISPNVLRLAYKYADTIQPLLDQADRKTADYRRENVVS